MAENDELRELVKRLDETEDLEEYQKVLGILRSKTEEEKVIVREFLHHTKRRGYPPYPKKQEPPPSNESRVQRGTYFCPETRSFKPYYPDEWHWYCAEEDRWVNELERYPPPPDRFQGVDENGVRKCFYRNPETGEYQ